MNKKKPNIPKGTRDFNSDVICKRNFIFQTIKSSFECFGYSQIETPAMESISTLSGKYGDEGDRLIFKILNSGDYLSKATLSDQIDSKSLTKQISEKALRYDLTVPFARFVAQNRNDIIFPFKRYQMQNVWRADKPQKGRYREFFQCDADIIGTNSLLCEIELIQLYDDVFTKLNLSDVKICINNRKILSGIIELMNATDRFDEIVILLDKIDTIGQENLYNLLKEKGLAKDSISKLNKFLNVGNLDDLSKLMQSSKTGMQGIKELSYVYNAINNVKLNTSVLQFDVSLARGLNYYTGCILEVKRRDVSIGSIGGGGRYDDLTSIFGLNDVSGVGISFGVDRIYLVMEELNLFPKNITNPTKLMFVNFGENESLYCLPIIKQLRDSGVKVDFYPSSDKMKKQFNYADKKGIKYVALVGEDEILSGLLTVKDMQTGNQEKYTLDELMNKII
jgi:histidyl-tRNA synthetase